MYRLKRNQTTRKCFNCGARSTYRAKYFMFGSCNDCLGLAELEESRRLVIEEDTDDAYSYYSG